MKCTGVDNAKTARRRFRRLATQRPLSRSPTIPRRRAGPYQGRRAGGRGAARRSPSPSASGRLVLRASWCLSAAPLTFNGSLPPHAVPELSLFVSLHILQF